MRTTGRPGPPVSSTCSLTSLSRPWCAVISVMPLLFVGDPVALTGVAGQGWTGPSLRLGWPRQHQRPRQRLDRELPGRPHDLAVQLPWLLVLQGHLQPGELDPVQPVMGAAPEQDVYPDRQPPDRAAGDHGDRVQFAVVGAGVRE